MKPPAKNLFLFLGLVFSLGLILFLASQKFIPLILERTLYYCQSFISSFSVQLPPQLGLVFGALILLPLIAVAAKLTLVFWQTRRLKRIFRLTETYPSQLDSLAKKLKLERKIVLVDSSKPLAFCLGFRSPKIFISAKLVRALRQKELEAVLRHEKYHLENKDSLTMLVATSAQSLFPFFPLISDLLKNYRIEREISADQEAVESMGSPRPLITALRKLLSFDSQKTVAFAPAIADFDTLEPRIKALTEGDFSFKKVGIINSLVSFLFVILLIGALSVPVYAINSQHEKSVAMVCLAEAECSAWCKENNTVEPPQGRT